MHSNNTQAAEQDGRPALDLAPCSASSWKVHVWVCGTYAGAYEHATSEAAEEMAAVRNRDYGIMRCHYEVEDPQPRCPACAAYAELMSGLGQHRMVPACDHLLPLANPQTRNASGQAETPLAAPNRP